MFDDQGTGTIDLLQLDGLTATYARPPYQRLLVVDVGGGARNHVRSDRIFEVLLLDAPPVRDRRAEEREISRQLLWDLNQAIRENALREKQAMLRTRRIRRLLCHGLLAAPAPVKKPRERRPIFLPLVRSRGRAPRAPR